MKKRTEEEWRQLHENAIIAVLSGLCSNNQNSQCYIDSLVREAIIAANTLVEELKRRENHQKEQRYSS